MFRNTVLASIFILLPGAAYAQAGSAAAEEGPWSGTASLGFLSSSGNTNTASYNTSFGISYAKYKWTHAFSGAANGADESDMVTAEAYQADWKSSYDWSENNYLFGLVAWRKDRFSGVAEQLSESIGYGRRIIDTPAHLLNAEIGAGYRNADLFNLHPASWRGIRTGGECGGRRRSVVGNCLAWLSEQLGEHQYRQL